MMTVNHNTLAEAAELLKALADPKALKAALKQVNERLSKVVDREKAVTDLETAVKAREEAASAVLEREAAIENQAVSVKAAHDEAMRLKAEYAAKLDAVKSWAAKL